MDTQILDLRVTTSYVLLGAAVIVLLAGAAVIVFESRAGRLTKAHLVSFAGLKIQSSSLGIGMMGLGVVIAAIQNYSMPSGYQKTTDSFKVSLIGSSYPPVRADKDVVKDAKRLVELLSESASDHTLRVRGGTVHIDPKSVRTYQLADGQVMLRGEAPELAGYAALISPVYDETTSSVTFRVTGLQQYPALSGLKGPDSPYSHPVYRPESKGTIPQ